MDTVIEQKLLELQRTKHDYDELFDRFQQSDNLFREKESVYKSQILDLEDRLQLLKRKNDNFKFALTNQNATKASFAEDVRQLQQAAKLLEAREQEMLEAYETLTQKHQKTTTELQLQQDHCTQLQQENHRLQSVIEHDMVSLSTHQATVKQLAALEQVMQHETVSRVQHLQLVDDCRALRARLEHETVDRSLHEAFVSKYHTLERRIAVDYIPIEDHEHLKRIHQALVDEKRLLDESSVIVQESREANDKHMTETEAKVISLKGRVEQSERELLEARQAVKVITKEMQGLREELTRSEEERNRLNEVNQQAEQAKAMLQTQLGNAKMTIRSHQDAHAALVEEKKKALSAVEEAKAGFSHSLIESNQKIQSVFDLTEEQLRRRINEQTLRLQQLQLQLDSAGSVNDSLQHSLDQSRDHIRDLESLIAEARSQLQLQLTVNDSQSRENNEHRAQISDLKAEREEAIKAMQQLQRANRQMADQLDEFKALVFAELSPSYRRFAAAEDHSRANSIQRDNDNDDRLSSATPYTATTNKSGSGLSSSAKKAAKSGLIGGRRHFSPARAKLLSSPLLEARPPWDTRSGGSNHKRPMMITQQQEALAVGELALTGSDDRSQTPVTQQPHFSFNQHHNSNQDHQSNNEGMSSSSQQSRPATPVSTVTAASHVRAITGGTSSNKKLSPEQVSDGTYRLINRLVEDETVSSSQLSSRRSNRHLNNHSPELDLSVPAARPSPSYTGTGIKGSFTQHQHHQQDGSSHSNSNGE